MCEIRLEVCFQEKRQMNEVSEKLSFGIHCPFCGGLIVVREHVYSLWLGDGNPFLNVGSLANWNFECDICEKVFTYEGYLKTIKDLRHERLRQKNNGSQ